MSGNLHMARRGRPTHRFNKCDSSLNGESPLLEHLGIVSSKRHDIGVKCPSPGGPRLCYEALSIHGRNTVISSQPISGASVPCVTHRVEEGGFPRRSRREKLPHPAQSERIAAFYGKVSGHRI